MVKYYVRCAKTNNHTVREAACACLAELFVKIDREAVKPYLQFIQRTLFRAFKDDSWTVIFLPCLRQKGLGFYPNRLAPEPHAVSAFHNNSGLSVFSQSDWPVSNLLDSRLAVMLNTYTSSSSFDSTELKFVKPEPRVFPARYFGAQIYSSCFDPNMGMT